MKKTKCSGWCWPTIIYIALSLLGLMLVITNQQHYLREMKITSDEEKYKYLFKNVIQQLFWTFVLFMLCSRCKHNIAWFILFAPFIILLFVVILVIGIIIGKKTKNENTNDKINNYYTSRPVY
jgi:cell division protein FtsW (lipid II flippase)